VNDSTTPGTPAHLVLLVQLLDQAHGPLLYGDNLDILCEHIADQFPPSRSTDGRGLESAPTSRRRPLARQNAPR